MLSPFSSRTFSNMASAWATISRAPRIAALAMIFDIADSLLRPGPVEDFPSCTLRTDAAAAFLARFRDLRRGRTHCRCGLRRFLVEKRFRVHQRTQLQGLPLLVHVTHHQLRRLDGV